MKIYNKSVIGKVNPLPIPTPFIDIDVAAFFLA